MSHHAADLVAGQSGIEGDDGGPRLVGGRIGRDPPETVGAVQLHGHSIPPAHAQRGEPPSQPVGVPFPFGEGELPLPDHPVTGLVREAVGHQPQLINLQGRPCSGRLAHQPPSFLRHRLTGTDGRRLPDRTSEESNHAHCGQRHQRTDGHHEADPHWDVRNRWSHQATQALAHVGHGVGRTDHLEPPDAGE